MLCGVCSKLVLSLWVTSFSSHVLLISDVVFVPRCIVSVGLAATLAGLNQAAAGSAGLSSSSSTSPTTSATVTGNGTNSVTNSAGSNQSNHVLLEHKTPVVALATKTNKLVYLLVLFYFFSPFCVGGRNLICFLFGDAD